MERLNSCRCHKGGVNGGDAKLILTGEVDIRDQLCLVLVCSPRWSLSIVRVMPPQWGGSAYVPSHETHCCHDSSFFRNSLGTVTIGRSGIYERDQPVQLRGPPSQFQRC